MKHNKNTLNQILMTALVAILVFAIAILIIAILHERASADCRSFTAEEADLLTKCTWGEYRGSDDVQVAAVVWAILNRVDDARFPNTIKDVILQPLQFHGYSPTNPIDPRIQRIVLDVLARWQAEPSCCGSIGRVLPSEYTFFTGNGKINLYSTEYQGRDYWDWQLPSPYEEVDHDN